VGDAADTADAGERSVGKYVHGVKLRPVICSAVYCLEHVVLPLRVSLGASIACRCGSIAPCDGNAPSEVC
jgi:hypothetical protein